MNLFKKFNPRSHDIFFFFGYLALAGLTWKNIDEEYETKNCVIIVLTWGSLKVLMKVCHEGRWSCLSFPSEFYDSRQVKNPRKIIYVAGDGWFNHNTKMIYCLIQIISLAHNLQATKLIFTCNNNVYVWDAHIFLVTVSYKDSASKINFSFFNVYRILWILFLI